MPGPRRRPLISILALGMILATITAPGAKAGLLVTANDDAYGVRHDRVLTVAAPGVLGNDSGIGRTAAKLTNPAHGTVTMNTNGSFTYRPTAGYVGPDSFTYEARILNLGILFTDSALVTLTITNAAPIAMNDSFTGVTGVTLSVPAPGLLANDTDGDGDALTAALVNGGGNGSLSVSADGSFTFKSGGSFVGLRTFTYQVTDGIATSSIATVSINVGPAPTPTPPPPTPTPPPAPTPTPTAIPTATPTATPTPTLLPTLPPLPTLLPTLPPLPTLLPAPSPSGRPDPSARPTASVTPAPTSTGSAGTSAGPGSSKDGGSGGGPIAAGPIAGGPSIPPDGPGGGPGGAAGFVVGRPDPARIEGLGDLAVVGIGGLVEWAVPALVLSVPGLLLVIAVLAQAAGALFWVPVARRWLGGFGIRRRRGTSGGRA